MVTTINSPHLDADQAVFLARQLEYIKGNVYDTKYSNLKARQHIPVDFEGGPGAEYITYRMFDRVGMAKVVQSYSDDFPRASIKTKEVAARVRSLGASYGYSFQEVRAAQFAGTNLPQQQALAARRAIAQLENKIAYYGDPENDLVGLLTHPNIPVRTAPYKIDATSTTDQVIGLINDAVNSITRITRGVEVADTLLLPIKAYTYLSSTPRATGTDTTVLEFIERTNPNLKMIDWLSEAEGAGTGGSDVMIAYTRDPEHLQLSVPSEFEQFPPEVRGAETIVLCHERIAGVLMPYPLSAVIVEGV